MIDATYGHLAPDADERERLLLDTFDAAAAATEHYERRTEYDDPAIR
jgi:hypothetical protein